LGDELAPLKVDSLILLFDFIDVIGSGDPVLDYLINLLSIDILSFRYFFTM